MTSSNDPYRAPDRSAHMVRDWGSKQVDIGARGQITGESGLGDWPEGWALLRSLID